MENEIELKIILTPENVAPIVLWLNHAYPTSAQSIQLGNTYYDTPDQFFAQQQMGLRVRSQNQQYEMTLKTQGEVLNGVHIRPEYNLTLTSSEPDFKRLNSHFNLQMPNAEAIAAQLIATFSTNFNRHIWLIELGDTHIEVALDQGNIQNLFGETTICEVEFELKQGNIADLLAWLETLPKLDGMWLSSLSKAQRGYLLGQAVKFEQEIAKALQTESGMQLEAHLADYVREMPENSTVLRRLNALLGTDFSWQAAQHYLTSADYLSHNLARLAQLHFHA